MKIEDYNYENIVFISSIITIVIPMTSKAANINIIAAIISLTNILSSPKKAVFLTETAELLFFLRG